jgi:hypothetical protein
VPGRLFAAWETEGTPRDSAQRDRSPRPHAGAVHRMRMGVWRGEDLHFAVKAACLEAYSNDWAKLGREAPPPRRKMIATPVKARH